MNENTKTPKTALLIILFIIVCWFVYAIRGVLMPFIVSGILAYIISPVVSILRSFGIKRLVAVLIIYAGLVILFAWGAYAFIPRVVTEASVLKNNIPTYSLNVKYSLKGYQDKIEKRYPYVKENKFVDTAIRKTQGFIEDILSELPSYLMGLFTIFSLFFLIPVITFFFLLNGKNFIDWIFNSIPGKYVETSLSLFSEADEILGNYIRGQILESVIVGVLTAGGLYILGVQYALILGIIAGLSNVVPYVGPVASSIFPIAVAAIQYQDFEIVFYVVVMLAAVQFVDNYLLKPIILSKGMSLDPLTVMFALMAGAKVAGVLGMILAIPLTCILKTTAEILIKSSRA